MKILYRLQKEYVKMYFLTIVFLLHFVYTTNNPRIFRGIYHRRDGRRENMLDERTEKLAERAALGSLRKLAGWSEDPSAIARTAWQIGVAFAGEKERRLRDERAAIVAALPPVGDPERPEAAMKVLRKIFCLCGYTSEEAEILMTAPRMSREHGPEVFAETVERFLAE
jgi:hypothetical protein